MNVSRLLLLGLLVGASAGCTTLSVDLKYPGAKPLADSQLVKITDARPENDVRPQRKEVGVGRNFLYMPISSFVENRQAVNWVTEAIAAELERAGCDGVSVTGAITHAWVNSYVGSYWGTVNVHLEASRNGASLLSKDYAGAASESLASWSFSEDGNVSLYLTVSLQAALAKFVADLKTAKGP